MHVPSAHCELSHPICMLQPRQRTAGKKACVDFSFRVICRPTSATGLLAAFSCDPIQACMQALIPPVLSSPQRRRATASNLHFGGAYRNAQATRKVIGSTHGDDCQLSFCRRIQLY